MRKTTLSICCLLSSMNVSAITLIPTSELPSDIQSCFQSADCTSPYYGGGVWASLNYAEGVAALQYSQLGTSKWLMRYDLLSPPGTVAGTAWVSALNSYDIAGGDAHTFTLYFDTSISVGGLAPPYTLSLNDTDLGDGSAMRRIAPDFEYPENYVDTGELNMAPYFPLCLATGCGTEANFNLLHMNYVNGVFAFNPLDSRDLLFNLQSWYDCGGEDCGSYSATQSLYVHAVPVPAALPLLIGGLAAVGAAAHRRRVDTR